MQSFRLAHAGVVLELDDSSLFIDPGSFSSEAELQRALASTTPPAGLVITHEHADHWIPEHVALIRTRAPQLPIFTTEATTQKLAEVGVTTGVTVVRDQDHHRAGPFALDFYGRDHALLHTSIPIVDNVGVIVNGTFAYGGDALTPPRETMDVLGIPIGSPWSNIAQVMDFTLAAAPRRAYLTHDEMLSPAGRNMYTQRVRWCLEQADGELIEFPRIDADTTARFNLDA